MVGRIGRGVCSGMLCLLVGCATIAKAPSWQDVSRVVEPLHEASHGRSVSEGVSSSCAPKEAAPSGDSVYFFHAPYVIYAPEGKKVTYVENRSSSNEEEPETINLLPGKYVVAPAYGARKQDVIGVTIEAQRLTEVRFDIPK